ncbi:MAG: uncharacterized protein A8A55_2122 [Amphiamblys sp. WSBS2006]|nr:MAG: uncharacterized protein A8A55_2122 [Amphiamblys sp. WSBS2006]
MNSFCRAVVVVCKGVLGANRSEEAVSQEKEEGGCLKKAKPGQFRNIGIKHEEEKECRGCANELETPDGGGGIEDGEARDGSEEAGGCGCTRKSRIVIPGWSVECQTQVDGGR